MKLEFSWVFSSQCLNITSLHPLEMLFKSVKFNTHTTSWGYCLRGHKIKQIQMKHFKKSKLTRPGHSQPRMSFLVKLLDGIGLKILTSSKAFLANPSWAFKFSLDSGTDWFSAPFLTKNQPDPKIGKAFDDATYLATLPLMEAAVPIA